MQVLRCRKDSVLVALTLTLITTVLPINTYVAQADQCQYELWVCIILGRGGNSGPPHRPLAEQVVRLENLLKQGKATANDSLLLGYFYGLQKKYPQSEFNYRQGLQGATDINQQAIAKNGLAEVFAATGRKKQAISNLIEAQNLYETIGQKQQVLKIQRQLRQLQQH